MAHEIDTTVNANGALYLYNKPGWHGLGTVVEKPVNYLEIPDLISINYQVNKVPMFIDGNSGIDESGNVIQEKIEVPNKVATIRNDTNSILGVVGKDYEVVQNTELFHWMKAFSEFGDIIVESAGSLFGGSLVFALMRLEGMGFSFGQGENVNPYLMLSTSHDGSKPLHTVPTPIRVICANTFRMAEQRSNSGRSGRAKNGLLNGWKLSHTKHIRNRMEEAKKIILRTHESLKITQDSISFLQSKKCDIDILNDITKKIWEEKEESTEKESSRSETLRENRLDDIKRLYNSPTNQTEFAKDTLWGAYNSITEYLEHFSTIRVTGNKNEKEQRFFSSQFGTSSMLKDKAWTVSMELASSMA